MTPQELKASRAAKAEYQKMLARGRKSLLLPPEDPKSPSHRLYEPKSKKAKAKVAKAEAKTAAELRKAVEELENKPPKFAAFRWKPKKGKEEEEAANESTSARRAQTTYARREAEGTLSIPPGERRHRRGLRAPYPVQNPGKGGKAYRWANLKGRKAKRLSKEESGRDVKYSKGGKEYKVDVGMKGEN